MNPERRKFITTGIAATAAVVVPRLFAEASSKSAFPVVPKAAPADRTRPPAQELAQVLRFVQVAHLDLDKVKEMVARDPRLVVASWD